MEPKARFEGYSRRLETGLLTIEEVAGAVLDALAEASDLAGLWTSAPESLRREILAYLSRVGPDNVPPAWVIGVNDPEWRVLQTGRRKQVASKLLER